MWFFIIKCMQTVRKKILYFDNDASVQEVVKLILNEAGYDVETRMGNIDIDKNVISFKPNLILLDYYMP